MVYIASLHTFVSVEVSTDVYLFTSHNNNTLSKKKAFCHCWSQTAKQMPRGIYEDLLEQVKEYKVILFYISVMDNLQKWILSACMTVCSLIKANTLYTASIISKTSIQILKIFDHTFYQKPEKMQANFIL